MLYDMRKCSQYLYFSTSVAMKVEDGLSRIYIFLFDDESADIFTLVVGDIKVDTFNNMGIDDLFFGTNRVDIV